MIPPSGHPYIVIGQGTIVVEFQRQMDGLKDGQLDVVIVPSAGGALLAGIALSLHGSGISLYGVEPQQGGADLAISIFEGRRRELVENYAIADGLRSPVAESNWPIVSDKGALGFSF